MTMSNNTCNKIQELNIYDKQKSLFDLGDNYIIPLYQRPYAWEDKEITQLIEDIDDVEENQKYFIGSLIVSQEDGYWEVIDGQQRLTTLFLLLNVLGINTAKTLSFACRDKSNYTLCNIENIFTEKNELIDFDRIQANINNGFKILKNTLGNRSCEDKEKFIKKLTSVILYRIEVPEHTDLNRYFEIMNTRGEQLEQHDILKASLMGYLQTNKKAQDIFALIWDACSDMDGYVQMHFKDTEIRKAIFSWDWNTIPPESWGTYEKLGKIQPQSAIQPIIDNIIKKDFKIEEQETVIRNNKKIKLQYQSIIEFPVFLLHCLKCYVSKYNVTHESNETLVYELLDDKKLVESFNRVIDHGVINGQKIVPEDFSKKFIILLLRMRFLFDKYIIKRVFDDVNVDGVWSLDEMKASSSNTPSYSQTKFIDYGEWYQKDKNPKRNKEVLMIQSALRVSYTSPKSMHWITKLLELLIKDKNKQAYMSGFCSSVETIARDAVITVFFNKCPKNSYMMGVNTPHIVFNYLDYLLWKDDFNKDLKSRKYQDFVFEFRNSVEHWYPQNPSGNFKSWEDGKDTFGNLCLLQRNINSQFSNLPPEAKKTYNERIEKGSIKLRIMSNLTIPNKGKLASYYWKDEACKQHENEMIKLLKEDCGIVEK